MGYWAKDGSYVREAGDEEIEGYRDPVAAAKYRDEREADRERSEANVRRFYEMREASQERLANEAKSIEAIGKTNSAQKPNVAPPRPEVPGVPEFVYNPETLGQRRARANYWMRFSQWSMFKAKISGKMKKFDQMWEEFADTQDETRQAEIVEQMEKMYPTTQHRIDMAERKEGGMSR